MTKKNLWETASVEKHLASLRSKFPILEFVKINPYRDDWPSRTYGVAVLLPNGSPKNPLYPCSGAIKHITHGVDYYGYPSELGNRKEDSVLLNRLLNASICSFLLLNAHDNDHRFSLCSHFLVGRCKCDSHEEYLEALKNQRPLKKVVGKLKKGLIWAAEPDEERKKLKEYRVPNGLDNVLDIFRMDFGIRGKRYNNGPHKFSNETYEEIYLIMSGKRFTPVTYGARFKLFNGEMRYIDNTFIRNLSTYIKTLGAIAEK